jgi:hypothetical protein
MKVKRFKNLWLMGLIIFGTILGVFYLLKLIVPEFVVELAQVEPIVNFGNFVQGNIFLYYLVQFLFSIFGYYFYACACCRKKKLKLLEFGIIVIANIILFALQILLPQYYYTFNIVVLLIVPVIICKLNKQTDIKYLYSTCICFAINIISQLFSLEIRGLSAMITSPNIITLTLLVLDGYIWLVLLYNYFNYKEGK